MMLCTTRGFCVSEEKKTVSIKGLPGVNVSSAKTLKGHQCVSDERNSIPRTCITPIRTFEHLEGESWIVQLQTNKFQRLFKDFSKTNYSFQGLRFIQ